MAFHMTRLPQNGNIVSALLWNRRIMSTTLGEYKHQTGEKVIAMTDNNGYVLAPLPVAPVNETDMVLLPEGLHALKQVATEVGVDLRGA